MIIYIIHQLTQSEVNIMIVVNCLGHSGFTVESETHMLIFDYSEGNITRLPENKKLYVFISHAHSDHFDPRIFGICKDHPYVKFVVSDDIKRSDVTSYGVEDYVVA
ncbi:MAG: MBL fold metallo-hydrolase, partial [Clostridia bacterium]|nr:MBL fold metallo-hydrolase [Clostridia bacterium]